MKGRLSIVNTATDVAVAVVVALGDVFVVREVGGSGLNLVSQKSVELLVAVAVDQTNDVHLAGLLLLLAVVVVRLHHCLRVR